MCGVPYHAAEGYIAKLIRRGFKVAVCEQVEDPRFAKKLVRREVTRVVTPGTAADSSLNAEENNFLAAVATFGDRAGFAALDLSTGEFRATEFAGETAARRIQEELEQLRPKEFLYGSSAPLFEGHRTVATGGIVLLSPARPRRRSTTGSFRPTMLCRCSKITLGFFRSKASGWRERRRLRLRREPSFITYDPRSAARLITSTASASTNGKTAWCSTQRLCATWS